MNLVSAPTRFLLTFLLLTMLLSVGCKRAPKQNALLKCQPSVVKLVGVIRNETFPGPPNYEDIKKGDVPEDYWILRLDELVDVAEDPEYPVPDENKISRNVREMQLNMSVFLDSDYGPYRKFLDKRVVVFGELCQGVTVQHKTEVLINVREIKLKE